LILTLNGLEFGIEEEQHVGVGVILVIKKYLPGGVVRHISEEGLDGGFWTTGDNEAEWEGWIVGGF
jgi:hypothetical protein